MRVNIGDSGLCCCRVCVTLTAFKHKLISLVCWFFFLVVESSLTIAGIRVFHQQTELCWLRSSRGHVEQYQASDFSINRQNYAGWGAAGVMSNNIMHQFSINRQNYSDWGAAEVMWFSGHFCFVLAFVTSVNFSQNRHFENWCQNRRKLMSK